MASDELVPAGATSPDDVNALLERLAEARLVTLSDGSAEVAHEALIREWPRLRRWLEEDRAGIRAHRQLGAAVEVGRLAPAAVPESCRRWHGSPRR